MCEETDTDPRLTALLALAAERGHPLYAAATYRLAKECGDTAAMQQALVLGAARYRPEPCVYARTETSIVQLTLLEDAA